MFVPYRVFLAEGGCVPYIGFGGATRVEQEKGVELYRNGGCVRQESETPDNHRHKTKFPRFLAQK